MKNLAEEKEPEVLPCPFCGELPILSRLQWKWSLLHTCETIKANIPRGKQKEIIEKWNKRT